MSDIHSLIRNGLNRTLGIKLPCTLYPLLQKEKFYNLCLLFPFSKETVPFVYLTQKFLTIKESNNRKGLVLLSHLLGTTLDHSGM